MEMLTRKPRPNNLKGKEGRPPKYARPSLVELDALYSKYTTKQLSEYYGVPEATVKYWVRSYRQTLKEVNP